MKKKILFVNDEMTMGGVARILNNLLKQLDLTQYEVDVLILNPHGELMSEIPQGINVLKSSSFFKGVDVNLKESFKHFRMIEIYHKLCLLFFMKSGLIHAKLRFERKNILQKQYDVEFSAKEGFCTIFVSAGDSKRKLNWVQVDYSKQNYSKNHMPLMITSLRKIDMNIACSHPVATAYSEIFLTEKIKVIHNLIDDKKIVGLAKEPSDILMDKHNINLITVARFHPQKGIDRLLEAFAKLRTRIPSTKLFIIGDGDLKNQLVQLCTSLGLDSDVTFMGLKQNPYPYIKQADLFVMSSLYEGYPTIVIESMLSGTPVLSTEVAGIDEQIHHEVDGWIVQNTTEALTEKLIELCIEKSKISRIKFALGDYHYPNDEIIEALENEFNFQS